MSLKIFHTADLHIGMRFNSYPEPLKTALKNARVDSVAKMVTEANQQKCDLFVIAGDLFDSIKADKKTINTVAKSLGGFHGDCVIVMPGNHDYDNGLIDLWQDFIKTVSDKVLFLDEERPYSLTDYGLNAIVYPAPCHNKHSEENNIGWIKDEEMDEKTVNIGIAHGALEGLSPDMDKKYYGMGVAELNDIPVDIWLLGHTHITYPIMSPVSGEKVFNPGTPEPDGLDCKHGGVAWVITVDDEKIVKAETVSTGIYKFLDLEFNVHETKDLDAIVNRFKKENDKNTVARIKLIGRVDEDVFKYRLKIYAAIEKIIAYSIHDDDELLVKITKQKISKEFTDGSFPQKFLSDLLDDEEALQIAYEMVTEARE